MAELLRAFLEYDYLFKMLWVSALVGGICGLLSCFVTLKGWSLMGDALSHAVVPGVVISHLLGAPLIIGAFIAGLLATSAMGFVKARTPLKEDAVIGMVFVAFFALGLFLISLFPRGISLQTIIFGNILSIADEDARQVIWISLGTLLVLALKWRDFALFTFDPGQARTIGLPVGVLHFLLLTLLSATAVAAMQTIGALLVVAMLITPGATAHLLCDRFGRMLWVAMGLGVVTSLLGVVLSYRLNGAPGGCIVVLQTICFFLAFFFAPKHGLLAQRRRKPGAQPLAMA